MRRMPQGGQVFALKDDMGFDFHDLSSVDIAVGETENISLTLEGAQPITVRIVTTKEFGRRRSKEAFVADLGAIPLKLP